MTILYTITIENGDLQGIYQVNLNYQYRRWNGGATQPTQFEGDAYEFEHRLQRDGYALQEYGGHIWRSKSTSSALEQISIVTPAGIWAYQRSQHLRGRPATHAARAGRTLCGKNPNGWQIQFGDYSILEAVTCKSCMKAIDRIKDDAPQETLSAIAASLPTPERESRVNAISGKGRQTGVR